MTAPEDLRLSRAWNYPLMDAIFQRRARRVPWGAEKPGGVAPFHSRRRPFPLDELEEALLAAAGAGITGVALADLPYTDWEGSNLAGNLLIQFTGRTYPSPCSSHGTELFFTNDEGTYFINMRGKQPDRMMMLGTAEDRAKVLELYRTSVVRIGEGRMKLPVLSHLPWNRWHVNQPGTTMFIPVSDVTWQYINGFFVTLEGRQSYIYDDLNGNAEPLKVFAGAGRLDRRRAVPLSAYEQRIALQVVGVEQSAMLHNMALVSQGIGLGSFVFPAMDAAAAFGAPGETGGLGFRHALPLDRPGRPSWLAPPRPVAVGLDGLFEAYCPPYHKDMRSAVRAVYEAKWGERGIYTDEKAFSGLKDRRPLARDVPRTADWIVEATEVFCQYVWDTYGRLPATVEPMSTLLWFQALHLDTDFYDQFYQPGAYTEAIRDHMKHWHPDQPLEDPSAERPVDK